MALVAVSAMASVPRYIEKHTIELAGYAVDSPIDKDTPITPCSEVHKAFRTVQEYQLVLDRYNALTKWIASQSFALEDVAQIIRRLQSLNQELKAIQVRLTEVNFPKYLEVDRNRKVYWPIRMNRTEWIHPSFFQGCLGCVYRQYPTLNSLEFFPLNYDWKGSFKMPEAESSEGLIESLFSQTHEGLVSLGVFSLAQTLQKWSGRDIIILEQPAISAADACVPLRIPTVMTLDVSSHCVARCDASTDTLQFNHVVLSLK